MKRIIALLLAMALALSLSACGGTAKTPAPTETTSSVATEVAVTEEITAPTEPEVIYDTNGNAFTLPFQINKAIVINSSIYEMICVLGKDDVVIGVSDSTKSPASALEKQKFGDWKEPNVEMILEAEPDIVFGYASWLDTGIAKQLNDAGIPVAMLNLSKPEEILGEVAFLGKLMDAEDRANSFIQDIQSMLDLVAERTADVEPISVYWEGYSAYKSVGNGSGGDSLMKLANVRSVTGEEATAYPEISDEWLLETNPQMIVKTVSSSKGIMGETVTDPTAIRELYDEIVARPGWTGVDAVKNGNILLLHNRICTTPLGLGICPLYVAKMAYPEKFEDVDPNTYLKDMLNRYWNEELTGIWTFTGADR